MGTYYSYVNFTRREFVRLSDLRDGGDKENAALYCAPALAWLLVWPHVCGDGYRGRWRSYEATAPAHDVPIVTDGAYDPYDLKEDGFLNITAGLLQSMRTQCPGFVEDYHPRTHDVALLTHVVTNGSYALLDAVSASCKCGWKAGPLHGDHRDETLSQIVSDHLNSSTITQCSHCAGTGKRSRDARDSGLPPVGGYACRYCNEGRARHTRKSGSAVYRAELSAEDVCDLIEALEEVTGDKGSEYESENATRLIALRDRLADIPGERL